MLHDVTKLRSVRASTILNKYTSFDFDPICVKSTSDTRMTRNTSNQRIYSSYTYSFDRHLLGFC